MGDSITFGQYVEAGLRWTTLLTERLQERYLDTAMHIYALNRGVSGETTRQGLERFPADVQQHQPDIVTIQFGLNDCNCWLTDGGLPRVSAPAFRANLLEMVMRARRFGARHLLLANNHPTLRTKVMLSGEGYEAASARYGEIIRAVAEETRSTFCDIRAAFAGYTTRELAGLLLPYPDHLHLSPEGHRLYANTMWPYLLQAVETTLETKATAMETP
jgi:lysophospholipase L1-like esterase